MDVDLNTGVEDEILVNYEGPHMARLCEKPKKLGRKQPVK
jgi:hypothetical protein